VPYGHTLCIYVRTSHGQSTMTGSALLVVQCMIPDNNALHIMVEWPREVQQHAMSMPTRPVFAASHIL